MNEKQTQRIITAAKAVIHHWSFGNVVYSPVITKQARTEMMMDFIELYKALNNQEWPPESPYHNKSK